MQSVSFINKTEQRNSQAALSVVVHASLIGTSKKVGCWQASHWCFYVQDKRWLYGNTFGDVG